MNEHTPWTVPGYVAEELVGFGACGEVWRGRAAGSGEVVALKRLRDAGAGAARLRREAALLAAVDHPHLLRMREIVGTDGAAVLVLDYAAGGSLAMLLRRRGTLRPGELVTVLAPIAAALAHAHDEGLVHADVTPANVLFDAAGRPLLADLGVARIAGEQVDPQTTPEYVDPAVAAGAAPGPASDVFMAAAVGLYVLTGAPPWPGASPEEALAQAAAGRIPDLRALVATAPEPLFRVLRRALSPRPDERGTAARFALDLRYGCQPEPIQLAIHPGGDPATAASARAATPDDGGPASLGASGLAGAGHLPPGLTGRRDTDPRAGLAGAGGHLEPVVDRSAPMGSAARVGAGRGAGMVPAGGVGASAGREGWSTGGVGTVGADVLSAAALTHVVRVSPPRPAPTAPAGSSGRRWWRRRHGVASRRFGGRRARGLVVASCALAVAVVAGLGWAASSPPEQAGDLPGGASGARPPAARPAPGGPGGGPAVLAPPADPRTGRSADRPSSTTAWLAVVERLDALRARAYESGDVELLRQVYAGGAHLAADTRQLRRLTSTGDTFRGVRHRLRIVAVLSEQAGRVRLRVAQALAPSYRIRSGRVIAALPGQPQTTIVIELVRSAAGWRLT